MDASKLGHPPIAIYAYDGGGACVGWASPYEDRWLLSYRDADGRVEPYGGARSVRGAEYALCTLGPDVCCRVVRQGEPEPQLTDRWLPEGVTV